MFHRGQVWRRWANAFSVYLSFYFYALVKWMVYYSVSKHGAGAAADFRASPS